MLRAAISSAHAFSSAWTARVLGECICQGRAVTLTHEVETQVVGGDLAALLQATIPVQIHENHVGLIQVVQTPGAEGLASAAMPNAATPNLTALE